MGTEPLPFNDVQDLASRLGNDPNLVQGRSGAISVKDSGLMWVRAEAASLAIANQSQIFIPLRIDKVLSGMQAALDDPTAPATLEADMGRPIDKVVRPLPFTALDALFPHRIVAHVTPPDVLAWSITKGAPDAIQERLKGLRWAWAPFAPPGAALNKAVASAIGNQSVNPDILIIGHWGLVVAGEDCAAIDTLLRDLTDRLRLPARPLPSPNIARLNTLLAREPEWRLPVHPEIHALGRDPISLENCKQGLLTAGQAMSLGMGLPLMETEEAIWQTALRHEKGYRERPGYLIAPGAGVVVSSDLTPQTKSVLAGVARMTQRLVDPKQLEAFTSDDIAHFLLWQSDRQKEGIDPADQPKPRWSTKV
jgi:hypothetical protein